MSFKKVIKALVPAIVILGVTGGIGRWMLKHRVVPETKEPEENVTNAEYVSVHKESYQVTIETSGEVSPRTKSALIPQVAGEILNISPNFRNGGFFEEGEVLLELDDRDYVAAVTESAATLAQAEAALKLEEARSLQAIASWKDLGRGGEPSELTARKPQLAESKAAAEAAAARLERARRDLTRTKIVAPYAGYVRQKSVDLGQFVSPGSPLAEIFAIDYVEVRLPLDPKDLDFIDLPERYRSESSPITSQPRVLLRDSFNSEFAWEGKIVRAEGEFDVKSRKLFVIAQVDDPYAKREDGRPPLKVGQFVNAEIEGKRLDDVFVIPEQAVRFGTEVKIIDDENRIRFGTVDVIWSPTPYLVVREGLSVGDRLCLTLLPYATDGILVEAREKPDPHGPAEAVTD